MLLFALRALIPVGFEPSTDGSFAIVLCQDGLPPPLKHSSTPNGGGGATHGDHCLFCNSPSSAPAPLLLSFISLLLLVLGAVVLLATPTERLRLVHVPQARAPPVCA